MRIVFLLDRVAAIVRRIEQLSRQSVSHRFLAPSPRKRDDPANRQRATSLLMNFDRNLIGGSSYSPRFHFHVRADVLDSLLENLERLFPGLLTNLQQRIIKSLLGLRFLAAPHDAVSEL